jgi:hypothetical protein
MIIGVLALLYLVFIRLCVRQLDWRTWYGIPGHYFPLVAAARPPG